MAVIKTIKYKCDICGKESMKKHDINQEIVPCYGEGTHFKSTTVDMCLECSGKIRKVIFDNFAEIRDWYGLEVNKKF